MSKNPHHICQFGRRDVKIVGGKVQKSSLSGDASEEQTYAYSDLRASVQRPRDNLALEGNVDWKSKQAHGKCSPEKD